MSRRPTRQGTSASATGTLAGPVDAVYFSFENEAPAVSSGETRANSDNRASSIPSNKALPISANRECDTSANKATAASDASATSAKLATLKTAVRTEAPTAVPITVADGPCATPALDDIKSVIVTNETSTTAAPTTVAPTITAAPITTAAKITAVKITAAKPDVPTVESPDAYNVVFAAANSAAIETSANSDVFLSAVNKSNMTEHTAVPLVASKAEISENANMCPLTEQLNALRMQREILELKQHIQKLERGEPELPAVRRIIFEELDSAVPRFSGDDNYDIGKWFLQFEDYTNMCGYNPREQCLGVRRRLGGTARDYVYNLGLVTYPQMKASLIKMFSRTVTRQEVYRQLRARKLKPQESCISYVVAMQSIASQSDIAEQELIDIIVDGIPDSNHHIAYLFGANTLDELICRMDRYEQRRSKSNVLKSTLPHALQKPRSAAVTTTAEIRCFNCSQFGHYQSACPKPLRPPGSCFSCHQMGHLHNDCPKLKRNKSLTAAAVNNYDDVNEAADVIRVMQMPYPTFKYPKISQITKYFVAN